MESLNRICVQDPKVTTRQRGASLFRYAQPQSASFSIRPCVDWPQLKNLFKHVIVSSSIALPMAVSSSSCIHLGMPKAHFTQRSCLSRNPPVNITQRKPSREAQKRCVSTSMNLGDYLTRGESSCSKCTCLASLADFDAVAGSGWVPIDWPQLKNLFKHVIVSSSIALPMAVSSSSCIHLGMPKAHFTQRSCLSRNPPVNITQRKPSREAQKRCVSTSMNLGDYLTRGESSCSKCTCLASLADFDAVAGSGWVPIGDQVLLMTSVFLTYMAGVIPLRNSGYSSKKNTVEEESTDLGTTSESSGRDTGFDGDLESVWDVVKGKLLDSLDAIKRESTLGSRVLKPKPPQGKPPLSLYAISERPQLYLLWSCFQKLEEETNKISNTINSDEWMVSFTDIVSEAYQGACTAWLKRELCMEDTDSDTAMTPLLIKMLNEKEAIFDKIRKSGKEDLFAEFLYFHRFGSLRKASCYDLSLFRTHGVAILEDLMITLADGVASIYLELISVDSKFSDEMNGGGGLDICSLSSRALQKLRNEVALYQWLHQNMEAVVSMYEDRFDLYILQTQVINNPDGGGDTKSYSWWRKAKAASSSPLRYSVISDFSLPVKRTKELKALSGWRYYFSLFLELSDIGMPIIRVVVDKVSSVISFFLVTLIGRSVGLIFTGIRQSLRWK
ncbi:hypothetical protein F2Q69_00024745 [Brassica cretica]|uniref:Uncharacterized protein n=1 Tax=Brassica cretica TaxID=69181 RepID=A0A8S9Q763_BRACR|nr:hypothetical protein F2Q69_00024745 [Brassica cretica]